MEPRSVDSSRVARGHRSARRGQQAEDLAKSLIDRHFDQASTPHRDIGVDFYATLTLPHEPLLAMFAFQVKHGKTFRVRSASIGRLFDRMDSLSVILLHVSIGPTPEYRYLVLHDWALSHPEWPHRVALSRDVSFRLEDFALVEETESNFAEAMAAEARRLLHLPGAPFQTNPSRRLVLTEVDLFKQFGHLGRFELPERLREQIATAPGVYASESAALRALWRPLNPWDVDPLWTPERSGIIEVPDEVNKWLHQLKEPPPEEAVERERREFARFIQANRDLAQDATTFAMPAYRWEQTSVWRVLFEMYPESFRLLEGMFRYPDRWDVDQLCAGLLLLSSAANTDGPLAARAIHLLRSMEAEFIPSASTSYAKYALSRAYKFSQAEAGASRNAQSDLLDFLEKNHLADKVNMEVILHKHYYGDRASISQIHGFFQRKLEDAKQRDINTRRVTEALLEKFVQ